MELLQALAIAFAMSQVVLSSLLLASIPKWSVQQRIYGLLMGAIVAYLLTPFASDGAWNFLLTSVSTAVPGMFWLFSASLFDDHFKLRRWQVTLVGITVFLPVLGGLANMFGLYALDVLLITLPQGLEFVLLGLTLFAVAQHWAVDLVESRRSLRLWFCGINGVYIFVLILFREVVFPDAGWMQVLQYVPLGGILLATNAILLEYKSSIWGPSSSRDLSAEIPDAHSNLESAPAQPPEDPVDTEVDPDLVDRLQNLVDGEGVYREMGLTIGQLANRLEIPEYRLRQTINAGLGYRNFNDFLNSYRIREASQRLADPAQKDVSVLTIALDIGFRSLSSFNKAFKSTYDLTPTAFRRERVNGSE